MYLPGVPPPGKPTFLWLRGLFEEEISCEWHITVILYFWIDTSCRIYIYPLPMLLQEMDQCELPKIWDRHAQKTTPDIILGVRWLKSLSVVAPFVQIIFFIHLDYWYWLININFDITDFWWIRWRTGAWRNASKVQIKQKRFRDIFFILRSKLSCHIDQGGQAI